MKLLARAFSGALVSALALRTVPCHAETKRKDTCEAAYEQAQVARSDGDLLGATDNLVTCAGVSCPDAMQADCSRWLEELRTSLPTVVFRVINPKGADITGATVSIDGRPEEVLSGRAIPVNPGPHDVTVRANGYTARSEQLLFVEGHKLRTEVVSLKPIEAPSGAQGVTAERATQPPKQSALDNGSGRRITTTQWAAGTVAIVGAVGFAYFGLKARNGDHDLDRCSPNCSKAAVSDVKRDYLYSNLSLGIGLAGVAVGVVQYLAQDKASPPPKSSARLRFSVSPSFVQLQGSF